MALVSLWNFEFFSAQASENKHTSAAISIIQPIEAEAASTGASDLSLERDLAKARTFFGKLLRPERLNDGLVDLGSALFHDPGLSENGEISCASCHRLDEGGDDNVPLAIGISGKPGTRNSPTVFNLVGHVAFFWDGRASSLEEQVEGPISHPDEMGSNWSLILERVSARQEYVGAFNRLFDGGEATPERIKQAIAEFERSLVTDDAPFDHFVSGDAQAMTAQSRRGMNAFIDLGCVSCHQGPLFGGNLFQKFGVFKDYPHEEDPETLFKVPSLRNVEVTGPYFHNGSGETLRQAVRIMSDFQLGHELSQNDEDDIIAFLHSLTGQRFRSESAADERMKQ